VAEPVEQLDLLLPVAARGMVRREIADEGSDARADLVGEVGRGSADERLHVLHRRLAGLRHGRDLSIARVRHRLPADVLLLVTVLLWSFNFTAVKYALAHGFLPLAYAALRFGTGSAIFSGITYARERSLRIRRRDILVVLGLAAVGIWLNQMSFVYAVRLTSAATVALMFGTLPIFVALLASLVGTERLHVRHWLAVVVSFGGVALVASASGATLGGDLGGILCGLGAALTWAAYSVAVGPLMARYSPYRLSALIGLAAIVPLAATSAGQLADMDWTEVTALAWLGFLYSVLLSFVLTNVLWFTAIERVGAARSSLYANLQPFLGAVFAVLVLSESMDWLEIVGGVVIAAGIVVAGQPRPPAPSPD
jgi:drug/metabolite transporter (DMT)-like permease